MAIVLAGASAVRSAEEAEDMAVPPAVTSPADKPIASDHAGGIPPLQDGGPNVETSISELLCLLRNEGIDVIPALSGYLITDDPTFLPEDGNARSIARRVGRDRMLAQLISDFAVTHPATADVNKAD